MELLENLYKERDKTAAKLKKINDLISELEGVVEKSSLQTVLPSTTSSIEGVSYPKNGTWKERIKYVLALFNYPVLVADIADKISEFEPDMQQKQKDNLKTVIGQYCSVMGDDEIGVEKGIYRNKYFSLKK